LNRIILQTLVGEGANQGFVGMTAIAEVIRNRAKERNLTFKEVVLQPLQFSFWNDQERAIKFLEREGSEEMYQAAQLAWEMSETSNHTKGANLYHAVSMKEFPWWSQSEKVKKVAAIGGHVFYKE